jgi:2-amino-4-hydroxy-6-hydroxymethyldihydropteridine diphosphokinase
MPLVLLSLGSNIDPAVNIREAVAALSSRFGDLQISPVYESEAMGFQGDNFLNLAVAFETDVELETLVSELKQLEDEQGRDRSAPRFSGRTLDIDILTYGEVQGRHAGIDLPRAEIAEQAFVLKPLADLLPHALHPARGKTYAELWQEFDSDGQRLWQIEFDW